MTKRKKPKFYLDSGIIQSIMRPYLDIECGSSTNREIFRLFYPFVEGNLYSKISFYSGPNEIKNAAKSILSSLKYHDKDVLVHEMKEKELERYMKPKRYLFKGVLYIPIDRNKKKKARIKMIYREIKNQEDEIDKIIIKRNIKDFSYKEIIKDPDELFEEVLKNSADKDDIEILRASYYGSLDAIITTDSRMVKTPEINEYIPILNIEYLTHTEIKEIIKREIDPKECGYLCYRRIEKDLKRKNKW